MRVEIVTEGERYTFADPEELIISSREGICFDSSINGECQVYRYKNEEDSQPKNPEGNI